MQLSSAVSHQPEIDLHKHGMRGFIRNFKFGWNRLLRLRAIRGTVDQLPNQFLPIRRHLVDQRFGEEAGRLGKPELHMRSASLIHAPQECPVFLSSKTLVELLPQERNHQKRRSTPKRNINAVAPASRRLSRGRPALAAKVKKVLEVFKTETGA